MLHDKHDQEVVNRIDAELNTVPQQRALNRSRMQAMCNPATRLVISPQAFDATRVEVLVQLQEYTRLRSHVLHEGDVQLSPVKLVLELEQRVRAAHPSQAASAREVLRLSLKSSPHALDKGQLHPTKVWFMMAMLLAHSEGLR